MMYVTGLVIPHGRWTAIMQQSFPVSSGTWNSENNVIKHGTRHLTNYAYSVL